MPTHTVQGTVSDADTGAPLVGVTVYATNASTGVLAGSATSDGSGGYSVDLESDAEVYVWTATGSAHTPDARGPIVPDPI